MIMKESKVSAQLCVCTYIYATEKQVTLVHLCNLRTRTRTPRQFGEPTRIAGFLAASRDETREENILQAFPLELTQNCPQNFKLPVQLRSRHPHLLEGNVAKHGAQRGAGFRKRRD